MTREEMDPRLTEVQLGIEVEAFLNSPVGRHLAQRAEDERERALEALAVSDAEDAKAIRELQTRVWRASSISAWLAAAIEASAHAEAELTAD